MLISQQPAVLDQNTFHFYRISLWGRVVWLLTQLTDCIQLEVISMVKEAIGLENLKNFVIYIMDVTVKTGLIPLYHRCILNLG